MAFACTLAYYITATITTVKCFTVQAPELLIGQCWKVIKETGETSLSSIKFSLETQLAGRRHTTLTVDKENRALSPTGWQYQSKV